MGVTVGAIVTPGEPLGPSDAHTAGSGVYASDGTLYASVLGSLESSPQPTGGLPTLRVSPATSSGLDTAALPTIGSTVTARVTKVTARAANTELLVADGRPLGDRFRGSIRQADVRRTEVDKVDMYACFAPGDLVRATVLSLGDRHAYFLSTADNHLGVVEATSVAGVAMVPINWREMQCPATNTREARKVAKVDAVVKEPMVM